MARKSKWPNEELWQQAAEWRKGGLTYSYICGQLAKSDNMRRFGLKEIPSEDTVQREVTRRLATEAPPPSKLLGPEVTHNDPELGPHCREVFYFGQRFRDLAGVPRPDEVLTMAEQKYEGAMWQGWNLEMRGYLGQPFTDIPARDPEEEAVAAQWASSFWVNARTVNLYDAFRQHLSSYTQCWQCLECMQNAFNDYGTVCRSTYKTILKEIRTRLSDISDEDAKNATTSLLMVAWYRGRGDVGLDFDYGPHWVGVQGDEGYAEGYQLRFGAWTSHLANDPAELQPLLAVHRELDKTPPYEEKLRKLRDADTELCHAVQEFQQSLMPDAVLRKLVLNGRCQWCP